MIAPHVPQGTLDNLRGYAERAAPVEVSGTARTILFLSHSDGRHRASVIIGSGATGADAWRSIEGRFRSAAADARWLRLDWIDTVEQTTWAGLRTALGKVKRNYFRYGISLDPDFDHAFLEGELNANAMLYGGSKEPSAMLNERNFRLYARKRHGVRNVSFAPADPVWIFAARGVFAGPDGIAHELAYDLLNAGRRSVVAMEPVLVRGLIAAASGYLAAEVRPEGRFNYGWHPCFDRPIAAYNSLRHASSLYAMYEAWQVTRDPTLWQGCEAARRHLIEDLIQGAPDAPSAAFLVDENAEVKLGGNAVAVLALLEHARISGSAASRAMAERLGEGILQMQDPATGAFVHVLNFPALDVKEPFRIIYYEGEAAFALIRLYDATGDERWLAAAERACEHFIRQDFARLHDHWLGYFIANLVRHRPEERYFRFGIANFADHLDFVAERITTFPTLLELMMASHELLRLASAVPEARHLLDDVDVTRFYKALEYRARYLLNGHFWPELAMYFANPARIVGSFFIRHQAFRVRIDDVEHYLSGLVAYLRWLESGAEQVTTATCESESQEEPGWNAVHVQRAAGGHWLQPPPPGWSARGLCTAPQTFRSGDVVALRPPEGETGVRTRHLARLPEPPAAWMAETESAFEARGAPILQVGKVHDAILAMGAYARARMRGTVIGVTGSAGKTSTVAMLGCALRPFGTVAATRNNGNLPTGVAWNLASSPWDSDHLVLELAIGRMAQSARLVRPDLAVFTNILPAHLEYHPDLPTIAARKSAIFEAMRPGAIVLLNRQMAERERVARAAELRGLRVLQYGTSDDCDAQLLAYDRLTGEVRARAGEREVTYRLAAAGDHMALNSLAALASAAALGHDLDLAAAALRGFEPLAGRGEEFALVFGSSEVLLIDESYNANPGSMTAALHLLASTPGRDRRIAVLGEMLNLGEQAADYHAQIARTIENLPIDRVHVLGELYRGAWDLIPRARRGSFARSREDLQAVLLAEARDGDAILIKGAHGSGLRALARGLRAAAARPVAGNLS